MANPMLARSAAPARAPAAAFWLLQAGGWLAFGTVTVLSRAGMFPLGYMAATKSVLTLTGLLTSLALRALYRRMLRQDASHAALLAAAVAASGAGSLAWTPVANALMAWVSRGAYGVGGALSAPVILLDGVASNAFVLLAWSLLYLGVKRQQTLQAERERSLRAEALAQRARLEALRYQINPHFLFNTLNAISTLVAEQRSADAARMIARLSDFLRLTLDAPDAHEVSLAEELKLVRHYAEIEQVRFGDRLAVRIDVDPAATSARVPAMLLQPLVENAVRHAVAHRAAGGSVAVAGRVDGDVLRLTVTDDGPGLGLRGTRDAGTGIGLANTRERLRQLYGDAQRFTLRAGDAGGLCVELALPFRAPTALDAPVPNVSVLRDGVPAATAAG